jgi:hypothetical protein
MACSDAIGRQFPQMPPRHSRSQSTRHIQPVIKLRLDTRISVFMDDNPHRLRAGRILQKGGKEDSLEECRRSQFQKFSGLSGALSWSAEGMKPYLSLFIKDGAFQSLYGAVRLLPMGFMRAFQNDIAPNLPGGERHTHPRSTPRHPKPASMIFAWHLYTPLKLAIFNTLGYPVPNFQGHMSCMAGTLKAGSSFASRELDCGEFNRIQLPDLRHSYSYQRFIVRDPSNQACCCDWPLSGLGVCWTNQLKISYSSHILMESFSVLWPVTLLILQRNA